MTAEPSPRPWRVEKAADECRFWIVRKPDGVSIGMTWREADAALIVDAVNERDDLIENLKTANANRERECTEFVRLVTELRAERDRAVKFADAAPHPGSAPWKEMRAVYAERDRLRDIVKRMANLIGEAPIDWFGESFVDTQVLLSEARAALGEGETPTGKGVGR